MRYQAAVTNHTEDQILVNTLSKCHCFLFPCCHSTQSRSHTPVLHTGICPGPEERCCLTDDILHCFSPPSILTGPCAGADFTTSEQQHHSVCKRFVVFGIWNLRNRRFHRLLLQIYIHSCLRESKNPISSQIECQGSVSKETENSPFMLLDRPAHQT